jgi:ferric-dicitrate binding protein FerR (iron transport regulator)
MKFKIMRKKMHRDLLERFFKKECSAQEAKKVILWLRDKENSNEVEAMMSSRWHGTSEETDLPTNLNEIYSNILEEIANDKIKTRKLPVRKMYMGIAASIIFLIVSLSTFYVYQLSNSNAGINAVEIAKITNRGEKLTTKLPDGTLVTLNSESKLVFPQAFTGDTRIVSLEGEAYFNVAKDASKPFIVRSGPVETRAIGTAFNVLADPANDRIIVSLIGGKVEVNSNLETSPEKYMLLPGDGIEYSSDGIYRQRMAFDDHVVTAWKDGVLVFNDDDVDALKRKIEKWYGVSVSFTNRPSKNWKFTSEYKNENLENVLEGLKYSKDINYVIENDNVEISFN